MSTTNIVLEYGHRHDVPMRMALSNTAEGAMGAIAPLIGGGLVVLWGYEACVLRDDPDRGDRARSFWSGRWTSRGGASITWSHPEPGWPE